MKTAALHLVRFEPEHLDSAIAWIRANKERFGLQGLRKIQVAGEVIQKDHTSDSLSPAHYNLLVVHFIEELQVMLDFCHELYQLPGVVRITGYAHRITDDTDADKPPPPQPETTPAMFFVRYVYQYTGDAIDWINAHRDQFGVVGLQRFAHVSDSVGRQYTRETIMMTTYDFIVVLRVQNREQIKQFTDALRALEGLIWVTAYEPVIDTVQTPSEGG